MRPSVQAREICANSHMSLLAWADGRCSLFSNLGGPCQHSACQQEPRSLWVGSPLLRSLVLRALLLAPTPPPRSTRVRTRRVVPFEWSRAPQRAIRAARRSSAGTSPARQARRAPLALPVRSAPRARQEPTATMGTSVLPVPLDPADLPDHPEHPVKPGPPALLALKDRPVQSVQPTINPARSPTADRATS